MTKLNCASRYVGKHRVYQGDKIKIKIERQEHSVTLILKHIDAKCNKDILGAYFPGVYV
jgi:hypothetical protein